MHVPVARRPESDGLRMAVDLTAGQEAARLLEETVELDCRVVDWYLLDPILAREKADRRDCWPRSRPKQQLSLNLRRSVDGRLPSPRDALRAGQNVVFGEGEDYVLAELRNVEDFGCHDGWHVCAAGWWIDATTVGARVHVAGMDRGVV